MQRRLRRSSADHAYSFGGLASCDDCDRSPRSQILISLAGPVAGFLFAAVSIVILARIRPFNRFPAARCMAAIDLDARGFELLEQPLLFIGYFEPFASRPLNTVICDLL